MTPALVQAVVDQFKLYGKRVGALKIGFSLIFVATGDSDRVALLV